MIFWLLAPFLLFSNAKGVTFETKQIVFNNGVALKVEVAQTNEQRAQGLMLRTKLPAGQGMLFVFERQQPLMFWMKNTLIPLSIAFFDKQKKLLEILDMEPPQGPVRDEQLEQYKSKKPALYALEVPRGWFTQQKIKAGATFSYMK